MTLNDGRDWLLNDFPVLGVEARLFVDNLSNKDILDWPIWVFPAIIAAVVFAVYAFISTARERANQFEEDENGRPTAWAMTKSGVFLVITIGFLIGPFYFLQGDSVPWGGLWMSGPFFLVALYVFVMRLRHRRNITDPQ